MKMKTIVKFCLLLVAITATHAVLAADSDKYAILNSWEKGSYTLLQDCTSTTFQTVDNKETERTESRLLFNWQIEAKSETADGRQEFNMKLLRVMVNVRINGKGALYFDSRNGKSPMEVINEAFKQMKRTTVTLVFKNGVPVEVQGCDNFWKGLPEAKSDEEKSVLTSLQTLADADNLKQTFETLVYLDASEEVGKGDSWKNQTSLILPAVGNKSIDWTCHFDSLEKSGGTVWASVSGKGESEFKISGQNDSIVSVKMESSAVYNTRYYYPKDVDSRAYITLKTKSGSGADQHEVAYLSYLKNKLTIDKR